MKRIVPVLGLLWLVACGKEMGRIPFSGAGAGDSMMTLKAGDVDLWTDIDLSYEGSASLAYQVQLEQGGATVATVTCDPLGPMHVKTMWSETNIGPSHSRHGMGKMSCSASLPSGGATSVKATLAWKTRPPTVTLRKADLVIKQ